MPAGPACPPTPREMCLSAFPSSPPPGVSGCKIPRSGADSGAPRALDLTLAPPAPNAPKPRPPRVSSLHPLSTPFPLSPTGAPALPTVRDRGPSTHPPPPRNPQQPGRPFPRPGGVSRLGTPAVWAAGRSLRRESPALRGLGLSGPLNIWVRGLAFQM